MSGTQGNEIAALIARMEQLEDKVNFLLNHEPAPYRPASRDDKAANDAAVVELLRKGNLKEAMRLYREKHEMSLPDVQRALDELKHKHGI